MILTVIRPIVTLAVKMKKLRDIDTGELAFISRGYCNWKDATGSKGAFHCHEQSHIHKRAVECMTHSAGVKDIGEMLSSQLAVEKRNNRDYLFKVIQFLARQGMALRGDNDESDSNFMQLLKLRSIDDTQLLQHLEKKSDKYTSPQIKMKLCRFSL